MDIVNSRCEPDDHAIVNRGDEMVPRIVEKLGDHLRINGIVEDVGLNRRQSGSVGGPEQLDFHGPA
jgi:hypothetical protein